MQSSAKSLILPALFFCVLPLACAQDYICGPVQPVANPCSFSALNSDCDLGIDRLRPLAPPTINIRRGHKITVEIAHPSPFEQLSLDLKSATSVAPADQWQSVFSALSPAAAKFTLTAPYVPHTGTQLAKDQIKQSQADLLKALQAPFENAGSAFSLIKPATQPPPGDVCFGTDDPLSPWLHIGKWIAAVDERLDVALKIVLPDGIYRDTSAATGKIKALDAEIAKLGSNDATQAEIDALKANQKTLSDAVTALDAALIKLRNLKKVIDAVPDPETPAGKAFTATQTPKTIIDLQSEKTKDGKVVLNDRNDLNEQWSLDFVNTLMPAIKNALSDPSDAIKSALADLSAGAPSKTSLVTITAAYQTPPYVEVSTGLMVPMRPFHSYASAAVATNGTVTGYIVQESLTYTVVPGAQVNFVLKNWVAARQRAALFGSLAVGYNPTSSSVEFGFGPSFSWKSLVLTGLADVGRDTQLAGGFTVGQSLGTSSTAKPLTSTVWQVKPAVGISIRIPLGGSGK
jgi:hypothetical protein